MVTIFENVSWVKRREEKPGRVGVVLIGGFEKKSFQDLAI